MKANTEMSRFAAAVPGVRNVTAETFVTFSPTGEAVKQEMELSVRHRDLGELFGGKAPNLVFVTACDANYWRDGRLQNLVASIQTWEPGATIRFYAMGEEGEEGFRDMVRDASSWRSVQVLRVPDTIAIDGQIHATPPHMKHARKYAFKPAVIWDALGEVGRKEGAVFWIDAGAEIRRPVDGVREILRDTGFFSVEHAYKFPDQVRARRRGGGLGDWGAALTPGARSNFTTPRASRISAATRPPAAGNTAPRLS